MADIDVDERRRQAEELNKSLGLSDPGNLDSFLSGRSSFEEYKKDNEARANNDTSDRQYDSQDTRYFDQKTNQLTPEGLSGTLQLTGGSAPAAGGNLDYWKDRGIDWQNIFTSDPAHSLQPGWSRTANGYNYSGPALAAKQNPALGGASRQSFGFGLPGTQFDDPYSKLLEDIAHEQLNGLRNPQANPALDQLNQFLSQRFGELSNNPGYSNAEAALLRTQALDPIEADRQASQRRVLERTAARGFLPSSGLNELGAQESDQAYDKMRAATERDLGINAINRRDQNLAQALQMGQLAGITIPTMQRTEDTQRRQEMLNTANLLYQLPRQSMMDALAVIGASPAAPDLFSQAVQLMNSNQNSALLNNQQNMQFWNSIGELFGNLFGG